MGYLSVLISSLTNRFKSELKEQPRTHCIRVKNKKAQRGQAVKVSCCLERGLEKGGKKPCLASWRAGQTWLTGSHLVGRP